MNTPLYRLVLTSRSLNVKQCQQRDSCFVFFTEKFHHSQWDDDGNNSRQHFSTTGEWRRRSREWKSNSSDRRGLRHRCCCLRHGQTNLQQQAHLPFYSAFVLQTNGSYAKESDTNLPQHWVYKEKKTTAARASCHFSKTFHFSFPPLLVCSSSSFSCRSFRPFCFVWPSGTTLPLSNWPSSMKNWTRAKAASTAITQPPALTRCTVAVSYDSSITKQSVR